MPRIPLRWDYDRSYLLGAACFESSNGVPVDQLLLTSLSSLLEMEVYVMFTRRLTDEERSQWQSDGYFVLMEALKSQEVTRLSQAIDALYREHSLKEAGGNVSTGMDRRNVMEDNDLFVELIDHPGILGVVLDLLGHHI